MQINRPTIATALNDAIGLGQSTASVAPSHGRFQTLVNLCSEGHRKMMVIGRNPPQHCHFMPISSEFQQLELRWNKKTGPRRNVSMMAARFDGTAASSPL